MKKIIYKENKINFEGTYVKDDRTNLTQIWYDGWAT